MKRLDRWMVPAMLILVSLLLTGCGPGDPGWSDRTEMVLGTVSQIRVYSDDRTMGDEVLLEAFARVQEVENRMSAWHPESQIGSINAAAGRDFIAVTDDVLFIIEEGLRYYDLTGGLFHIGLGTLTELWGLSNNEPQIPDRERIESALNLIDIQAIQIRGNEVMIRERGTAIDLGGIAKGYAVDEAARILRDLGIQSGIINFGGDVYAMDAKPDGEPWYVGIKEPIPGVNSLVGRLAVTNRAVVTSGDYERYVVDENTGERFHHILNPKTGRPASNELASVTIVSDTALEGDILSTAVFVMGLEEGARFVLHADRVEGIFVTQDGEVLLTPGLVDIFELMNEAYLLSVLELEPVE